MENYKFIEIAFENCESIIIPKEIISKFDFGELLNVENEFTKDSYLHSDKLELYITYSDESDLNYNPYDYEDPLGMFIGNPTSNKVQDRPNILGRILMCEDITSIYLLDENEKEIVNFYVPWGEEDYHEINSLQKVTCENGIMKIQIKK